MKNEITTLKDDINLLNNENDKLIKLNDKSSNQTRKHEMEIAKKLSKRELECSALWDSIKDMYSKL